MIRFRYWIALGCCITAATVISAAGTRQAGLWELTTTTSWQRSAPIPGVPVNGAKANTHTTQVCLTQEMIDKYGALLPQSRGRCSIANKVMKPGGMTADYVCLGAMTGRGALESIWTDSEHSKSKVHFVGTVQVGPERRPIEWTTESTAVFKSASCGNIAPPQLPGNGN